MALSQRLDIWMNTRITRIEDLHDGVYGAGLEATQMSTALLSGNLAFSQHGSILYSSGLINGQVTLRGPLSADRLTVGVGLRMGAGTRHWVQETGTGAVGVFHGGDEHDAFYTPGSLYATATLSIERLEEVAASEELALDRPILGGTGIYSQPLAPASVRRLRQAFELIHCGVPALQRGTHIGEDLVRAIINHIGRVPAGRYQRGGKDAYARIVRRACAYIFEHLADPISLDELAKAAYTSRRSLFRAFADLLDDTPQTYVRRLRLHRIRHDIASEKKEPARSPSSPINGGSANLARMAGWYRELFGERPSETLAQVHEGVRERPAVLRRSIGTNRIGS
jgi:AraC-like DNA-binding protein